jgi:hypothetical protein
MATRVRCRLRASLKLIRHPPESRDATGSNFPEPDLDEAARAADATREVMERWLPDSEISLGHKEATL